MLFESIIHSVTFDALIGIEFYEKIRAFTHYTVYDVLLHGQWVGSHNLSVNIDLVYKPRNCLYIIIFLQKDLHR